MRATGPPLVIFAVEEGNFRSSQNGSCEVLVLLSVSPNWVTRAQQIFFFVHKPIGASPRRYYEDGIRTNRII